MSFSMQTAGYMLASSLAVSSVDGTTSARSVSLHSSAPTTAHFMPGLDYGAGSESSTTSETAPESDYSDHTDPYECDELSDWTHELEADCDDGDDAACDDLTDAHAEYGDFCGDESDVHEGDILDHCEEIVEWLIELEEQCDAGDEVACEGLEESYDSYDDECGDVPLAECTVDDIEAKSAECACTSKREAHAFVVSNLYANLRELNRLNVMLDQSMAQLNHAERSLLKESDYYVAKIAGRCAVAGIEAAALGKSITVTKAACAEGVFGAQCLAAGFTVKEVTKYLATNKAVRAGVFEVVKGSLEIAVEVAADDDPTFFEHIPILGRWCESYKWSKKIFTAPEMIRLIGQQKLIVMQKRHELRVEINKIKDMIREADKKLKDEGC